MATKLAAITAAIGTGIGAVGGFLIGGPSMVPHGAKIGCGLGVKVAVVNKTAEAVDSLGNRANRVMDKAERRLFRAQAKLFSAIERVADAWATIMLCGYTYQIANHGVHLNMATFKEHCPSVLHSLDCASLSTTTLSMNMVVVAASVALIFKLKEVVYDSPRRV